MENPINEAVIDLPISDKKGEWSNQYAERLEEASIVLQTCNRIASKISTLKSLANRNIYTLDVYEQVNELVRFTPKALLALKEYDSATSERDKIDAITKVQKLTSEFKSLRKQFEHIYGKTRILTKPENYILDQDHHSHLANQALSFDWQFYAEILFLEKIKKLF